jgi:uncharacterized membrane protein YkvI
LLAVEFNASPQNKEKLIICLLQKHFFYLDAGIQTFWIVSIFLICFPAALLFDDVVLSIDLIVFPFVVTPPTMLAIHRRLRHFRDIVEERTTGLPGETFESLEPTMNARITLVYWVGALLALLCHFALSTSGTSPVISTVLMHYGWGGLLFLSSPLLFSLSSLRKKSTNIESRNLESMNLES